MLFTPGNSAFTALTEHGCSDDTDSDGTSLAGPQPSEGDKREFPGVSPVPSECGLEPKGDDRPNPMVGFLRYTEEEVNCASY